MKFAVPANVSEAVALLREDGARCLAGGQTLVAMMNAQLLAPSSLVSLRAIPDMDGIAVRNDGSLRIGAMALHARVAAVEPVSSAAALLAQTAGTIGYPAVRNQGTIGGSLAHADPAADYPSAVVCADAAIEIAGPEGVRKESARTFFRGMYETALRAGELIVAIEAPPGPHGGAAHYEKFSLVHGDFAVMSVAVMLATSEGRCTALQLAVGGCGPAPLRLAEAEAMLIGTALGASESARAGRLLADAADPFDDMRASAAFRRKLIPRLVARAIAAAQAKLESAHA
jgi:carbon-monoxide dehydrogenase medium subunit